MTSDHGAIHVSPNGSSHGYDWVMAHKGSRDGMKTSRATKKQLTDRKDLCHLKGLRYKAWPHHAVCLRTCIGDNALKNAVARTMDDTESVRVRAPEERMSIPYSGMIVGARSKSSEVARIHPGRPAADLIKATNLRRPHAPRNLPGVRNHRDQLSLLPFAREILAFFHSWSRCLLEDRVSI